MRLRTVGKCVKEGVKSVFRNGLMSVASIGTITATLLILGIVFCLVVNVQSFATGLDSNLGMVAFLKEGITEEEVATLSRELEQREDIQSFRYVSPEDAWEVFKQEILGGDEISEMLMDDLNEDNPLANSANIEIYAKNAADQPGIVSYLEASPLVRKVSYSANASQALTSFRNLVTYIGVALIAFLIFVALLLIANTIKLSVYIRRNEISIMKYIGATDGFVRLPFIIEGVLIGVLGAIIPTLLIYFGYNSLIGLLQNRFSAITSLLDFISVETVMSQLLPIFLILSITVGMLGSAISIRKHLKV